jgi:hypothetical protein
LLSTIEQFEKELLAQNFRQAHLPSVLGFEGERDKR